MSNEHSNEQNIRQFFNANKIDSYSTTSRIFKKLFKSRSSSVFTERRHLSDKFKHERYDLPENLGLSSHFVDVNFDKTNNYLVAGNDIGMERRSMNHNPKTKNKVYFEYNKEEYRKMKKVDAYKVKRIKDIQASSKRNYASDPGWYKPNYSAIYKKPVYPFIGTTMLCRDPFFMKIKKEKEKESEMEYKDKEKDKEKEKEKEKEQEIGKKSFSKSCKSLFKERLMNASHNNTILSRNMNMNKSKTDIKAKTSMSIIAKIKSVMNATLQSPHKETKDNKANTIRDKTFTKSIVKLPLSPKDKESNDSLMNSTINFNKMIGRYDQLRHDFKHKMKSFISLSPNFDYPLSKVKATIFSKVITPNEIKHRKITKLLHSKVAENNEYTVISMNRSISMSNRKNRKQKQRLKRSASYFLGLENKKEQKTLHDNSPIQQHHHSHKSQSHYAHDLLHSHPYYAQASH